MPAMPGPRSQTLLAALLATLALGGCGGGHEAGGPDALTVTPATAALVVGQAAQLRAIFQRDGVAVASVGDTLAWTSSAPDLASVEGADTSATVLALAAGSATLTASGGGLSATVDVTISAPTLSQIAILPASPSVAAGTTIGVTVLATYDNLATADVATDAAWTSQDPSIASVTGRTLTAFRQGQTTITAMYQGRASTMRVTVTDPVLRSIDVAPANPAILVGRTQQFSATGFFSDGTTTDITTLVVWSSSTPDVAPVSNAAGSQGLATARAEGQTTIEATSSRIAGTTTLTVEPLTLDAHP
jgi:trimeric autotransporter adhesin